MMKEMMKEARKVVVFGLALAMLANWSRPADAAMTVTIGKPIEVFADPSDVVIVMDTPGTCGSAFFHIQRTAANFKEFTAVALTAFNAGRSMRLFVASCANDRNILSHGSAF